MKLAPRMIQSMEILQLPILALQERIEQELNNNPVLEIEEPAQTEQAAEPATEQQSEVETADDFERINSLDDEYRNYMNESGYRRQRSSDEPDKKLEAIKNTAAGPVSLHEHLSGQWRLIEAKECVKKAGSAIIDYIDARGFLTVRLEQLHNKDNTDFGFDDLGKALELVQTLEPVGVGARDLKECLLIQMRQNGMDMSFESRLVSEHMDELLENRLPEIAAKMKCSIEEVNRAITHMSKLDTSPGLVIGQQRNHRITADVIVECDEDSGEFAVRLADSRLPGLKVSDDYVKMSKGKSVNENTKKFLRNNIRSAQWIIEAIEQRKNTLLRVSRSIVRYQREFFEKGQLYLQPLPMSKVADDVGVHFATVSRAVAGKYAQCEWGIIPLRKFFSGGMKDHEGKGHSWEEIRAELQRVIDGEDQGKPLSDEQIRKRLA